MCDAPSGDKVTGAIQVDWRTSGGWNKQDPQRNLRPVWNLKQRQNKFRPRILFILLLTFRRRLFVSLLEDLMQLSSAPRPLQTHIASAYQTSAAGK